MYVLKYLKEVKLQLMYGLAWKYLVPGEWLELLKQTQECPHGSIDRLGSLARASYTWETFSGFNSHQISI